MSAMKATVFLCVVFLAVVAVATVNPLKCEIGVPRLCSPSSSDWCLKHKGRILRFINCPSNFSNAEVYCRRHFHGHLVSIHNHCQNNAVYRLTISGGNCGPRTWIGGFELFNSGHYMWTDGSFFDFVNWVPGEPTQTFRTAEDCMEMNWHSKCCNIYL
nr:PREDICTED: lectin-like [Latimeria chalumnae]|eukprot:XP_014353404.1 PREDICTED: lectin-like [Latimeria chalumnae]